MKQVRVCLGRFQPFTLGHLKMATYKNLKGPKDIQGYRGIVKQSELLREQPDLDEISKQKTIILAIYTSKDKVDKKHPFDVNLIKKELEIVRKNYPEIEDVMYVPSADICLWGEMLKKAGYQASVWITGSDEAKGYVEMAMKVPDYEVKNRDNRDCKGAYTKSFYVESIERTDNSDFVSSISGTKVREALINNDMSYFRKAMPKGTDHLFDEMKEAVVNAPEKTTKTKKIKEYIENNSHYSMKTIYEYLNKNISDNLLFEGGHVFDGGSDKIAKEDIQPTLDAYLKEIKRLFPKAYKWYEKPVTLGSVGKKDYSGDIDLAISDEGLKNVEDWNIDPQHIAELFAKYKKRARTSSDEQLTKRAVIVAIGEYINSNSDIIKTSDKSAGSGALFSQFEQIDHKTGEKNGKTVQIDQMFGDVDWLKFAYYSDAYVGNVKGLHRTQLMLHLFSYKNHTFAHGKGITNKTTGEQVANKPEKAVELLNELYNFHIDEKTLQNYHNLQDFLKKHLSEKDLHGVWDIYLKTLDSTRCDIPEDLQTYWIDNQDRLGLTGKFLPSDSNLYKLKK